MTSTDFYPRPPRGGRPIALPYTFPFVVFLSTPSARRATITLRYFVFSFRISIHALREEGDLLKLDGRDGLGISIHALREEGDLLAGLFRVGFPISIHALREEGDVVVARGRDDILISIHALREEGDRESTAT